MRSRARPTTIAGALLALVIMLSITRATAPAWASAATRSHPHANADLVAVAARSRELIVVSARADASTSGRLSAYARPRANAPWRRVLGPWPAELGRRGLSAHRHEGDGTTPVGSFALGSTLYGNASRPAGLHEPYRRLSCGDWWDEDPGSPRYNEFVTVPCGVTPGFANDSEALWTETVAYPFFAVIEFNADPIRGGPGAPGSGIFLHSWVGAPTDGCVGVHRDELLAVLRWLRPSRAPVMQIGAGRLAHSRADGRLPAREDHRGSP